MPATLPPARKRTCILFAATTFDDEGAFDEKLFRGQLQRMAKVGMPMYIAGPGLGAAYLLTPGEREQIYYIAVEELKGKVPCRAGGREPNSAAQVLEYLKLAEKAGMDAAQIYSLDLGHGAKPTVAEMDRYYSTVLGATDLPLYLSCHHSSGYVPPVSLLEGLVKRFPHIVGIHYGGSDLKFLSSLIQRFADRLEIHCAGCYNSATVLCLGGNGFMGAEGNIAPHLFASAIRTFDAGDMAAFQTCYRQLLGLYAIVQQFNNGSSSSQRAIKPLMNALGIKVGGVREPTVPIGSEELAAMVKAVKALGIPEHASAP